MLNEQEHFFSSLIKSFAERPELLGNAGRVLALMLLPIQTG